MGRMQCGGTARYIGLNYLFDERRHGVCDGDWRLKGAALLPDDLTTNYLSPPQRPADARPVNDLLSEEALISLVLHECRLSATSVTIQAIGWLGRELHHETGAKCYFSVSNFDS